MLTRTEAHKTALSVPGTTEKLYFRKPSIFFGDDFVAVVHDKHEAVVLQTSSIEMRDVMLQAEPELFYITDHYKNWPGILVRLSALDRKTLKALIAGRVQQIQDNPKKKKAKPVKKPAAKKKAKKTR